MCVGVNKLSDLTTCTVQIQLHLLISWGPFSRQVLSHSYQMKTLNFSIDSRNSLKKVTSKMH